MIEVAGNGRFKQVDVPIDGVCSRLVGLVRGLLGPCAAVRDPFPVEESLNELGIASLQMVKLLLAVEAEFDIEIPPRELTEESFRSVSAIGALIERILSLRRPREAMTG